MTVLMEFTEVEPPKNCACGGCAARRRARLHAARTEDGGHPAARGARRAAVLVATVGTVLGGATSAIAIARLGGSSTLTPSTPQGPITGLYGSGLRTTQPVTTRAEILQRAQIWVDQQVPYSMSRYWSDGYRQDCSGFVSMAWGLGSSQSTWTLLDFADPISPGELEPGDVLIHNNPDDPEGGSHAVIFGGWTDGSHSHYIAYEQTRPHTLRRTTPYAYWSHSDSFLPYRYRGLSAGNAFPGADKFGPGKVNPYVTQLGEMLVDRGGSRFYSEGPSPDWGDADRQATGAFQLAQGWRGSEADGYPGKDTWDHLVNGKGSDIPPAQALQGVPPFPGADKFGPGQVNRYVQQLGERLVSKGYGRYYSIGPDPQWGGADRRATQAFQLAQGWRDSEADGYPGPDTWRLLFS